MRWVWAVLAACALLAAGCSGAWEGPDGAPQPDQPVVYDLVIRGGLVVDGSGAAPHLGDVAILDDRVAKVGDLGAYEALEEIDAAGLVVAPGFINPHSHTHDQTNPHEDLDATASLMQGITTEFGGMDGRSPLPIGEALSRLEQEGTGVNFGLFVGQGTIRAKVMGNGPAEPTQEQLAEMASLVRQAMEEGAFGLSTGLEYVPGKYASTEEIVTLAAEIQPYGGVYSTHLRSEGDGLVEAVEEALAIGSRAGVPVEIAHLKVVYPRNWGKEKQVVALIDAARARGQRVFADVYPYLAPDYGVNRPFSEWAGALPPEHLQIVSAPDPALVGKNLAQAAAYLGESTDAAAARLAADSSVRVVAEVSSDVAMRLFYQQPWTVVSTDGEAQPKQDDPTEARRFHPRSYGTYPRLLGQFVREEQLLPLEKMIHKMTGAVAEQFGLQDRGCLRPGCFADVVVFDPETVRDRATWLSPQEYPTGIHHVLVNGLFAVRDGQRLPGRPGRVLRRGQ